MFVNFIVSNAILWLTLFATVMMAHALPRMLIEIGLFEWLGNILAGAITGALVGRSYDLLIEFASTILPRPITKREFGAAAAIIVALVLIAAAGVTIPILQNPKEYPVAFFIVLAIWVGCSYEVWGMMHALDAPSVIKIFLSCTLAMILCLIAAIAVVYVITQFVQYYNAGMAAFMAGWAAGLTGWMVKKFSPQLGLENEASGKFVAAVVLREGSVVVAVVIAYIIFKINGTSPLLFSMVIGFFSAIVAPVIGQILHSD